MEYRGMEVPSGRFIFKMPGGVHILATAVVREDGNVDLTSIEVTASNVTSDTLRSVKVGDIRNAIVEHLRSSGSPGMDGWAALAAMHRAAGRPIPEHLASAEQRSSELLAYLRRTAPRRGPSTTPEDHLREVAIAYLAAVERDPGKPIALIAEGLGRPRNTVADWVRKARQRGWLTAATPGKAGAQPGQRLVAWRNQQENHDD
jgi:hypothetical protein